MNQILIGDSSKILERMESFGTKVNSCVTSPPYFGLRDYGINNAVGTEETPAQYIERLVYIFSLVRKILCDDGSLWVVIGDSYASPKKNRTVAQATKKSTLGGALKTQCQVLRQQNKVVGALKRKDLIGIPWMFAFAMRDSGWYLRQDIIWHKPNPMPESVKDRFTKSHEHIFLFTKKERYFFDNNAIKENARSGYRGSSFQKGKTKEARKHLSPVSENKRTETNYRNKRDVWTVATQPYKGEHFAAFPQKLIETCILASTRPGGIVLDPFMGSGTTAAVAKSHGRQYVGIEINPDYLSLIEKRIAKCEIVS